jgi:hypothetical protein
MTSRQQSITSMISVVAEGRCALLATYQIFQFIVGYAMAQAVAVNLMYTHGLQMGNYQFLIQVGGERLQCLLVCCRTLLERLHPGVLCLATVHGALAGSCSLVHVAVAFYQTVLVACCHDLWRAASVTSGSCYVGCCLRCRTCSTSPFWQH